MFIFNTTFHIEDDIHDECLLYLKRDYIPFAIKSGVLSEPRLLLVQTQQHSQGSSYSLQFRLKDIADFENWTITEGEILQGKIIAKFKDKVVGFITILEEIEL